MKKGDSVKFREKFKEKVDEDMFMEQSVFMTNHHFSLNRVYGIEDIYIFPIGRSMAFMLNDIGELQCVYFGRIYLATEIVPEENKVEEGGLYCSCNGDYILNTCDFKTFKVCKVCGKEKKSI